MKRKLWLSAIYLCVAMAVTSAATAVYHGLSYGISGAMPFAHPKVVFLTLAGLAFVLAWFAIILAVDLPKHDD